MKNRRQNVEAKPEGRDGGFTLLEVMLALLLMVILMGGIYAIADGSIQLATEVSQSQNREMLVHSFIQLAKRNIESLPGNGGMTLLAEEDGRFYVTEVAFIEAPLAFSFAAVPAGFNRVFLKSEGDPRGWLNVYLLYLNIEEEDEFSQGTGGYDEEEGIKLPLLDRVSVFEWRFYDPELEEWQVIWEDETKKPSFVELTLGFFDGNDPIRTVFWVPPVANPEDVIRSLAGGGGGGGPGGGGPGGGGPGGGGPGGGGPGIGPGGGGPGGGGPGGGFRRGGGPGGGGRGGDGRGGARGVGPNVGPGGGGANRGAGQIPSVNVGGGIRR